MERKQTLGDTAQNGKSSDVKFAGLRASAARRLFHRLKRLEINWPEYGTGRCWRWPIVSEPFSESWPEKNKRRSIIIISVVAFFESFDIMPTELLACLNTPKSRKKYTK